MKTITIEIEDNYWLEILNRLKDLPIKIIQEKTDKSEIASTQNTELWSKTYINQVLGKWQGDLQRPPQLPCEEREYF